MATAQDQTPVRTDIGPNQQVYTTGYVSDSQKPKLIPSGQVFTRKIIAYAEQVHITDANKADVRKGHPVTILGGDLKNEAGEHLVPLHLNGATVQAKDGDWVVNEEGVSKVYNDKDFHKLFTADVALVTDKSASLPNHTTNEADGTVRNPAAQGPWGTDKTSPDRNESRVGQPLAAGQTPAPVSSAFDHPVRDSWETDKTHPSHVPDPAPLQKSGDPLHPETTDRTGLTTTPATPPQAATPVTPHPVAPAAQVAPGTAPQVPNTPTENKI
jgi:hypothetical protein